MLSFPDMALLSGVALIVFGPERMPQIARQVGRFIGEVRQTSASFVHTMEQAAHEAPVSHSAPAAPPSPVHPPADPLSP